MSIIDLRVSTRRSSWWCRRLGSDRPQLPERQRTLETGRWLPASYITAPLRRRQPSKARRTGPCVQSRPLTVTDPHLKNGTSFLRCQLGTWLWYTIKLSVEAIGGSRAASERQDRNRTPPTRFTIRSKCTCSPQISMTAISVA
jgi:hypothetical protein